MPRSTASTGRRTPAAAAGHAQSDPRARILTAAREEFALKGLAGARMQAIADRAGVNKAMLHYYFDSKQGLHQCVLVSVLGPLFARIMHIAAEDDLPVETRVERLVDAYYTFFAQHPDLPRLVLLEALTGGEGAQRAFRQVRESELAERENPVLAMLRHEAQLGELRSVDAAQTLVSLAAMVIFPFVGRPIIGALLDMDAQQQERFLKSRRRHVLDLLLHGVLPRP